MFLFFCLNIYYNKAKFGRANYFNEGVGFNEADNGNMEGQDILCDNVNKLFNKTRQHLIIGIYPKLKISFNYIPHQKQYINTQAQDKMKSFRSPQSAKNQSNIDTTSIQNMFQLQYQYQLFISRCQDTGQKPDTEKAKMFKQSFNKINSKKFPNILNLYSMRLGVNTIMKLISILEVNKFKTINLADNAISQYGMHAIKNLLNSTEIQQLSIASNMISQVGLSLVLQELIKNVNLKSLDLGIMDGSIRKNSFGIDGARCLAAVLLQNKTLQCLKLQDNDIGINGAQIISIPLKRNKTLKQLKISQNLIKTQGAQYVLHNAIHVESLDLSKNFIKSSIGPSLQKYLQVNKNLIKLNLQYNELLGEGSKILFQQIFNTNIIQLNIRGNGLSNRGVGMIANVFLQHGQIHDKLKILDMSNNQISQDGINSLTIILNHLQLTCLNINKNSIGDNGLIQLLTKIKQQPIAQTLQKLDISACKISDKSFLYFLQIINQFPQIQSIKCHDNYISQKYQKLYVDLLNQNKSLIYLNLNGNRISLSCMKAIKKIIDRNIKQFQQKQPKKMKSQIYNMKQKQKKIKEAQQKLEKQRLQITKLQQSKSRLSDNLIRIQKQQKQKRSQFQQLVRRKLEEIDQLAQQNSGKIQDLQKLKDEKQKSLDVLDEDLQKLKDKRKQLEYQLSIIRNQGQLIEDQFQRKTKMSG